MNSECSAFDLQSALAGNLPPDCEKWLHRHLEQCAACSTAIEQLAGGTIWCEEVSAMLTGDELDDEAPSREEWSEADFTVEHLEASDEPNVLGRLGDYDVLEIIGRGGMGVVLKGFDRELNRYVAIKALAPHLAQSPLAKKRFIREARAAAAVVHPNVMAIHRVQPCGRLPFLVMPLVAGESLAERLVAQGQLELQETLRIGMQAAAALAAAHEQGLVHRDVKPANILLEKGVERALLSDFGLARAADDVSMTRWGIIAGTPQYMSPEQAKGEPLDGRSDLFSLGCVLYEMATGVSPFRADSTMATLRRLIDDPPRAMSAYNPELPPWFAGLVERLLEKDPARRFSSAKEVSQLLEGCLAHVQQPGGVPLPAIVSGTLRVPPSIGTRSVPDTLSRSRKPRTIGALVMLALLGISLFAVGVVATNPPDISGQWSGDGWGQVALTRAAPGQYVGTYTDTDTVGNGPGKIELKWSRIERRYNGTWSEGGDRFGEISVRPVDRGILGALTTDRKSKMNTPHLAEIVWTRVGGTSGAATASPADSPQALRELSTTEVIVAGLTKPLVPWAWQELVKRPLTAAEAAQVFDGVTRWLQREYPAGTSQKLFWLDDFLNHLAERGLVTEVQKIRFLQALNGDLRGETLFRGREGEQKLVVHLECRSPFEDNLLGLMIMNELQSASVDGRPLKLLTSFSRQWNTSNLMETWQLPALAPGKHKIKIEVLSALVAASDLTGLDINAPSADWPRAKKCWTRIAEMELVIYPRDAEIVGRTQDPALDPVRSGGLTIQSAILRPKGTEAQAALSFGLSGKPPVPISFDVTLQIAGQKVACGQLLWYANLSDGYTYRGQVLTADLVRPPAQIRSVDVILTPDPRAVDEAAAIDRIWGKEVVFHNVPLKRLDLGESAEIPNENDSGNVSSSEHFVDFMSRGEFDKATADFDDAMKKAMPPAKLKELWDWLAKKGGKFTGRGKPRTENFSIYQFVYVPGIWERNKFDLRVMFDKQGKISRLLIEQRSTDAPAASNAPAEPYAVTAEPYAVTAEPYAVTAERFVDLLIEGDFDKATGYFDDTLKRIIEPKTLKSLWQGVTANAGKVKGRGPSRAETSYGYNFVFVPVIWENQKKDIQIVFDKKGRIGVYHFLSPGERKEITGGMPGAGRATIIGNRVIVEGAAPIGTKISIHAGDDRGNGWSCRIPKRSLHFTAILEKDSQGLNCHVALDSDDTILAMQHVQQIGSAEIAKGQFIFVEGWPSIKEDGACTVQIGEWTVPSGKKVAIYVTVSPEEDTMDLPLSQAENPDVARAAYNAAKAKAEDDIDIRHAIAAAKVATAEYEYNRIANKEVPGSVPQARLNELLLKCNEADLAVENWKSRQRADAKRADIAKAVLEVAQAAAKKRNGDEKAPLSPAASASAAVPASQNILKNSGIENGGEKPDDWQQGAAIDGVTYSWCKSEAFEGKASLCIEKTAERYFPIAQWSQTVDRRGDRPALQVSAQVKAEKVTKAVVDVLFLDEKDHSVSHKWAVYIGGRADGDPPANHDWKLYCGTVPIPKEAKKLCIGLQVYGPGKVWFDDVRAGYANDDAKATVSDFLDALRRGDETKAKSLLTKVARKKTEEQGRAVATGANASVKMEVDDATFPTPARDIAHVPSRWIDKDESGKPRIDRATWVCRLESGEWRVAGFAADVFEGEEPLMMNFEDPEDMNQHQKWLSEEMERRAKQKSDSPSRGKNPVPMDGKSKERPAAGARSEPAITHPHGTSKTSTD